MRAAVYRGPGELAIEEVPDPGPPQTGEARVAVRRAAVCGTDSSEWEHGPMLTVPPVILGHEFAGVVDAVGADVEGFAPGDRVVTGAGISCGACRWCEEGRTNLCADYHTLGLHVDGGLAAFVNVPQATLRHVPDHVSDDAAALAQPLSVAIHAVRRSSVRPGQSCVVIGAGGIGAFIVGAARARGIDPLVAIDIDDERLETAARLGATAIHNADGQDLSAVIGQASGPDGPDVIIEASGAPHAPAAAFEAVRRGGRVLIVGLQGAPREIDLFSVTVREIEVTTTLAHVIGEDLDEALEVLGSSNIEKVVIDKRIPLDSLVDEAIRPLSEGTAKGKIIVDLTA